MTTNTSDVTAGTNATASHYNDLRKDLLTGRNTIYAESDGATVTFDLDNGKIQEVTLSGNRTLALSNDNAGQVFTVILVQDGSGNRTVTWWANIKWQDDVEPTLDTAAGGIDVFCFIRRGSNYLGFTAGARMS